MSRSGFVPVEIAKKLATLLVVVLASRGAQAGETALDRYVARPDPSYSWKIDHKMEAHGAGTYIVDLKSQTWRKPNEVDRPLWQHWVTIIRPAHPASHTAFLFIDGGSNGGKAPKSAGLLMAWLSAQTNSVVVELKMVPNQPLVFHNDGVKRKEDDLIAYTWDQFLKGGDEEWPARLPMVKSAVRAMDCVQELLASKEGGSFPIDKFVVAGGSKRGWTTWLTGAIDKRAVAIIPISIDTLNELAAMKHHVEVYGFYAEAVGDYFTHNIMARANDPRMQLLNAIEDPYYYRDRLVMPKYIVQAAGDQYFCPDNSQFYFDQLPGEKLLRYIPNGDHGLERTDVRESVVAYYVAITKGTPRPQFSWTFDSDGSIRVKTITKPTAVALWQATNPKARDFRLMTIGRAFKSHTLSDQGEGVYVGKIAAPPQGWTASFVELSYDVGAPYPLKLTTSVRVTPDTCPYPNINPLTAPKEVRHQTAAKR
ncbi:MAG TPA: PhoPQ-activated pathogenicity-related family protein [Planctomycetaceae bacterium]|nr:PhoPQ-activated pathogenicity-related family protein [Planctomycetaceae bacterium]